MINLKNILKVLLIAVFVVAWSGNAEAQGNLAYGDTSNNINTTDPTKPNYIPGAQPLVTYEGEAPKKNDTETVVTGGGGATDPTFCGSDLGIFKELVQTGQLIFNRLRDLIYVVAGFGIIAVAVGGFFGNLNWKWLGAIVISLVVIATAGELIVLMTGCETFGSKLITNTLTAPTGMSTAEYNEKYTESNVSQGLIDWDDSMDKIPGYTTSTDVEPDAEETASEAENGNS